MSDLLDWVEKLVIENLKMYYVCVDVIVKDVVMMLIVFFVVFGGGFVYGVKVLDQNSFNWLLIGIIVFMGWFFVLSLLFVWKCFMFWEMLNIYNELRNIY